MIAGLAGSVLWLPTEVFTLMQLKIGEIIQILSPLINTQAADIFTMGLIINFIFT